MVAIDLENALTTEEPSPPPFISLELAFIIVTGLP